MYDLFTYNYYQTVRIQAGKMIQSSTSPRKKKHSPRRHPRDNSSLFCGLEIHRHAAASHKSSWSMAVSRCATGTNISITFANSWNKNNYYQNTGSTDTWYIYPRRIYVFFPKINPLHVYGYHIMAVAWDLYHPIWEWNQ